MTTKSDKSADTAIAVSSQPEAVGSEAPVGVHDAWAWAFDLVKGIRSLLSAASCSDDGLDPAGATAMEAIVDRLIEHMETIDGFFRPTKEGGAR